MLSYNKGVRYPLAALTGLAFVILNTADCGEPVEPVGFQWRKVANIPAEYDDFELTAVGPQGLYAIGRKQHPFSQRLLVYDGAAFDVIYNAPEDTALIDVAFWYNAGFLAAEDVNDPEPYLIKFENDLWKEPIYYPAAYSIDKLRPAGADTCWMVCGLIDSGNYAVVKYDRGAFEKYLVFKSPPKAIVYCPNTQGLFVLPNTADVVRISRDSGVTWRQETITLPPPFVLDKVRDMAGDGNSVYFVISAFVGDTEYDVVSKRTGGPGEGVYEVFYLGGNAPSILTLDHAVFRNENDGLAVGVSTGSSISFDGRRWTRESVPPDFDYGLDPLSLLANPRGGYWCLESVFGSGDLIWHP
jgi:hypothetical protein